MKDQDDERAQTIPSAEPPEESSREPILPPERASTLDRMAKLYPESMPPESEAPPWAIAQEGRLVKSVENMLLAHQKTVRGEVHDIIAQHESDMQEWLEKEVFARLFLEGDKRQKAIDALRTQVDELRRRMGG